MKVKIFRWTLIIEKTFTRETEVENYRKQFENRQIAKIQAVKNIRMVFLGTGDYRGTLKGALAYIERRDGNGYF